MWLYIKKGGSGYVFRTVEKRSKSRFIKAYAQDPDIAMKTPDIKKTFDLMLRTAVKKHVKQEDMPQKLYIISDMEFDCCADNSSMTNFDYAKRSFEKHGYRLPQLVFWNVMSRNKQQPVTQNEQGVVLVSGCSPQIFSMLSKDILDPYAFMMEVLSSKRYEKIAA